MSLDTAWAALEAAATRDGAARILDQFDADPDRLARMSVEAAGIRLDLSKQSWSRAGFEAALTLAEAADVPGAIARLFAGDTVNASEGRAALHMALRAEDGDGFGVLPEVLDCRERMRAFVEAVRSGAVAGADGRRFRAILHIGIGGSDLGPRLVWDALRPVRPEIDLRFVANVDGTELALTLAELDPAETLVIVVSKTFTTQETLANAEAAKAWLAAALGDGASRHLAAVSTALEKTSAFGIAEDRVFGFWDWVGGRYSLWSAVGLSTAVALGWKTFEALLGGARRMDRHVRDEPVARNAAVLLALAQVFNRNGLDRAARSVVPYAHRLRRLPDFLQQLEMESNGKRVATDGKAVTRATAPVVFGGEGTNVQHAYFQQMHQGTDVVPLEFLAVAEPMDGPEDMHRKLLANVAAQAEALLVGREHADPQRAFPGNRPSTTILLERLDPATLGALIALYEHKTYVEGVLWGINSFDQWGVELGKALAGKILPELEGSATGEHDPSTAALIGRLKG